VHLGTGNYHATTARLYTDYGLLSADPALGEDVHDVFMQLTASGRGARLRKLLQSPFTLHAGLIERIQREAEHARAGRPARIIGKMNALVEPEVIRALYEASRAGVVIDLIVRGICCLRPGVPGLSESIRVISIVGRFLEHSRAFYFANAGAPELFAGSADWMPRNLFRRVETVFPVESPKLKQRLLADLELCLRDNTQARQMCPDGSYVRLDPAGAEPVTAQHALLTALAET
jgi:polyphosphate kinase